jgi:Ca2+-binding RTX toxin-like protein
MANRKSWTATEDLTWAVASIAGPGPIAARTPLLETVVSFDDAPDAGADLFPPEYRGMHWNNWRLFTPTEGYVYSNAVVSPANVAVNWDNRIPTEITDTTDFDFVSGWFTAGGRDLDVWVVGYDNEEVRYSQTIHVTADGAHEFVFNFADIDTLRFFPQGGNGAFAVDDLTFRTVTGTIAGTIVNDRDGDGAADPGEAGLKGRVVILDDNGNGVVDAGEVTATTNAQGAFRFEGLAQGSHTITQVLPEHWLQTGGPGAVEVDGNTTVRADLLVADTRVSLGDIAGTVFRDYDRDGVRGADEPAIAGWRVWIDTDGNGYADAGEQSTVTDATGAYHFSDLPLGDVPVRVELPSAQYPRTDLWEHWGFDAAVTVAPGTTTTANLAVTGGATPLGDTILGTIYYDVIDALGGDDRVFGGDGQDQIDGGDGNDMVKGQAYHDRLAGGAGDDLLVGGFGADTLVGGAGDDVLIGGSGNDLFVTDGAGADRIRDFSAGDHIMVTAAGVDDFADLTITARGDGSMIGWAGAEAAMFVRGVAPDALDASAFMFG